MTTTLHHELYRKWQVYADFDVNGTPLWVACSDHHNLCVTGTDRAEVISKIDQKEDGNV